MKRKRWLSLSPNERTFLRRLQRKLFGNYQPVICYTRQGEPYWGMAKLGKMKP